MFSRCLLDVGLLVRGVGNIAKVNREIDALRWLVGSLAYLQNFLIRYPFLLITIQLHYRGTCLVISQVVTSNDNMAPDIIDLTSDPAGSVKCVKSDPLAAKHPLVSEPGSGPTEEWG